MTLAQEVNRGILEVSLVLAGDVNIAPLFYCITCSNSAKHTKRPRLLNWCLTEDGIARLRNINSFFWTFCKTVEKFDNYRLALKLRKPHTRIFMNECQWGRTERNTNKISNWFDEHLLILNHIVDTLHGVPLEMNEDERTISHTSYFQISMQNGYKWSRKRQKRIEVYQKIDILHTVSILNWLWNNPT